MKRPIPLLLALLCLSPWCLVAPSASASLWSQDHFSGAAIQLAFDSSGRMISAPPARIGAGDAIQFVVYVDPLARQAALREVLDSYFDTVSAIDDQLPDPNLPHDANAPPDPDGPFGIDEP